MCHCLHCDKDDEIKQARIAMATEQSTARCIKILPTDLVSQLCTQYVSKITVLPRKLAISLFGCSLLQPTYVYKDSKVS